MKIFCSATIILALSTNCYANDNLSINGIQIKYEGGIKQLCKDYKLLIRLNSGDGDKTINLSGQDAAFRILDADEKLGSANLDTLIGKCPP